MKLAACRARFKAENPKGKDINLGCGATHMRSVGLPVADCGADVRLAMDGDSEVSFLVD